MNFRTLIAVAISAGTITLNVSITNAQKAEADWDVHPMAILPFQERGRDAAELGPKVTDLLFAELITNPDLYLVEREDINKLFDEQELNLSGLVNPGQAIQVGYLTGAKIIVTGSVLVVNDDLYLVAKIIGTETSRVLGASVKGRADDNPGELTKELAKKVAETITQRATELVAKPVEQSDRIAAIGKAMGKGKRPSVWISVSERHIGQPTIDPAAETELAVICSELGFDVIDADSGTKANADVVLMGEGFSQFASRHGNLVSVKARLELKAMERKSGKLLAVDRQVSVAVDLAEHVAAKTALQEAAASIASRLLPKIVEQKKKKKK